MRQAARSFQDLIVWQKAHKLVLHIYELTKNFPQNETYGLVSQLRRAAVSVPANLAEGFRKNSRPDKVRFLNIAQASLEETRYYLILTHDLAYGDTREFMAQLEEVSKLLDAYSRSIRTSAT